MPVSVAVIGECMLELTRAKNFVEGVKNPMAMNYGGDTINTSVYLARNKVDVSYVTALGDDINSDWLVDEWKNEGVDCSLVTRMPNSVPGMYMINVADDGERSFLYWRKRSPASRLFDEPGHSERLFQSLGKHEYLYLSGISLAILPLKSRARLFSLLEKYRVQGGKIVFDGNYRPNLWVSVDEARENYIRMYKMTDIALSTLEDEAMMFDYRSAEHAMQAIRNYGVPEVVVKMGSDGCLVNDGDQIRSVDAIVVRPVDTTAAGDSFNAGYLSARLRGNSVVEACSVGHQLASQVIQHQGAIIPK